jgi:phosphatidylglycerol:prolipoprotein diacylglycerol transferase
MHPVLFTIPILGHDVPGYGLMLMLGFLLSIWWATRRAMKSGANPDVILNCGFIALIAGVLGCRMMYVIHYWDQFAARGGALDIFWAIIDVRKGGLEFYGGFILATVTVPLWLKVRERVSFRWYMDIIAPSAAMGLAIGRLGCFLNGCCYGGVCEAPWAVSFPFASPAQMQQWKAKLPGAAVPKQLLYTHGPGLTLPLSRESLMASDEKIAKLDARQQKYEQQIDALTAQIATATDEATRTKLTNQRHRLDQQVRWVRATCADVRANMKKYGMTAAQINGLAAAHRSLSVHPTQLYSTITAGIVALLLNALYWRRTRDGQVILALLLIEPVTRYLLEIIRADNPHDTLGAFTISQGIAMSMSLVGVVGFVALRWLPRRSPAAELWDPTEDEPKARSKA